MLLNIFYVFTYILPRNPFLVYSVRGEKGSGRGNERVRGEREEVRIAGVVPVRTQ